VREWAGAALIALVSVTVVVAGCGSSEKVGLRSSDTPTSTVPVAGSWRDVRYLQAVVEVPSSWSVDDLSADPSQCVRFDRNAVYLGAQGPNATCPAGVLGRTDAVQIEPLDAQTSADLLPGAQSEEINGLSVAVQPYSQTTHSFVAVVRSLGVVLTITWSRDDSVAQRILNSVRAS
jgi:hypothetical protein